MQNKANLRKAKMKLNLHITKDYVNNHAFGARKNKANSKLNAALWAEARRTKPDNSGAVSGCLLPGVVPEIRNKRFERGTIAQNKANFRQDKMRLTLFDIKTYDNMPCLWPRKNKANLLKTQMTTLKARLAQRYCAKQSQFAKTQDERKCLLAKDL